MDIFLDFESRSRADIWTVGAWEYACHPSTEVLCLAYAIDDGPVHIVPYGPASNTGWDLIVSRAEAEIMFAIEKGAVFHAHNAYFERCIWRHVLAPKYGLPQIPLKQWRCTAAKACAHGLPKSLEGAAAALGLPVRKDKLGRSVMLKLCKPNKDGGWNENVEDFRRLFDYCKRDVEVERAIDRALPDLCPQEQTIWFLDQIINDTGIYCDIEAVDAARRARDRESERLRAALAQHTGGALDGVSRRGAVLSWLKEQGVDLENLQKATVRDAIEKAPEHVKFVLAARQQLGLTSNAKYDSLRAAAGADNRLRDTLVFHSASTGRWGGKLVQLQNLPRGDEKDTDSLIELLKAGGLELFSMFCNTSPLNALSSCIRGMFTATPGCDLFVADFAAIEARVVMWLAGAENGLEMFRKQDADPTYPDIYVQMARRVLGRNDLTKADKTERQLGKQIVLACVAKGTTVYTSSGGKAIENVQPEDKVWDGQNFVKPESLVHTGKKEVIRIASLDIELTPDHLLLTTTGWRTAAEIVTLEGTLPPIAGRNLGTAPSSLVSIRKALSVASTCAVTAAIQKAYESTTSTKDLIHNALAVLNLEMASLEETLIEIATSFQNPEYVNAGPHVGITLGNASRIPVTQTIAGMAVGAFPQPLNQLERSWNILLLSTGLITSNSPWIVLTTTGVTHQETLEWCRKKKTMRIVDTYDLANCGPNNMYAAGNTLAHNCGYGMGHNKFQQTCATYGIECDEELAQKSVQMYRSTFDTVRKFWYAQEEAFRMCLTQGKTVTCGPVSYRKTGDWIYCCLPSGRELAYHKARVETDGRLSHMTTCTMTKKYVRRDTYGGKLTENITQAVARDLMAAAMLRLHRAKYRILLTVHDEIVCERDSGTGNISEVIKLMTTVPDWAKGCPIAAEGWKGTRYKK